MKHTVDAIGKQCPVPVVMTKKVLDQAEQGDEIQVLVDNETAVNNLSRLAGSTGCSFVSKKTADGYEIRMVVKSSLVLYAVFLYGSFVKGSAEDPQD